MRIDGSSAGYRSSFDPESEPSGTRSTERKERSSPVDSPKKETATRSPKTDSRPVAVLHEVGNGIVGAVFGFFHGLAKTASDVAHGSLRALARPFEVAASIAIFEFAKVTSAVLTAVGLEPKGRRLNDEERATLQRMFGGALDLSAIRIKENAGAMTVGETARTIGDTIYFPGKADLKTLQHELGTTMVFVTHDQAEAMSLANRIAILSAGELQQIGTPDEVYDHPANLFVAEFIGSPPMNLIDVTHDGDALVGAGGWRLPAPLVRARAAGELTVGLRPEAIAIGAAGQAAEVVAVEPLGSEVIVDVRVGGKALKVRVAPGLRPQPGSTVHLAVEPGAIRLFDRSSGSALR